MLLPVVMSRPVQIKESVMLWKKRIRRNHSRLPKRGLRILKKEHRKGTLDDFATKVENDEANLKSSEQQVHLLEDELP